MKLTQHSAEVFAAAKDVNSVHVNWSRGVTPPRLLFVGQLCGVGCCYKSRDWDITDKTLSTSIFRPGPCVFSGHIWSSLTLPGRAVLEYLGIIHVLCLRCQSPEQYGLVYI